MNMTSMRPYLLRALYDWILDNELTPHVQVDAGIDYVEVPRQFVRDGQIVLNLAPGAIHNLELGDEWISFDARFSGSPMQVFLPMTAILGIYAKENGQGMFFQPETLSETSDNTKKPALRGLSAVDSDNTESPTEPPPTTPRPPRGKPTLKSVK